MSVQFDTSFNVGTIKTGYTPDTVEFFYSKSKQIGNYYYCYPVRPNSKQNIGDWAGPNPIKDTVKNEFKDIRVFGLSERSLTNRKVFKVLLNNMYIVELHEELLFEALTSFNCKKGMFVGTFRFGLMDTTFRLYPETPSLKTKMKELTELRNVKKSNKSTKNITIYKKDVVRDKVYKTSMNDNISYIYLGETNGKNVYFTFELKGRTKINLKCGYELIRSVSSQKSFKQFIYKDDSVTVTTPTLDEFKIYLEDVIDNLKITQQHIMANLEVYKNLFGDKYDSQYNQIVSQYDIKNAKYHNVRYMTVGVKNIEDVFGIKI